MRLATARRMSLVTCGDTFPKRKLKTAQNRAPGAVDIRGERDCVGVVSVLM
jgi:hypothetical protein